MKPKYLIDDHQLPCRFDDIYSYRLDTRGDTHEEMLLNATITAIDRFGDEIYTEQLSQSSEPLIGNSEKAIQKHINDRGLQ